MKILIGFFISLIFALPAFAGSINGKILIKERFSKNDPYQDAKSNENAILFITGLKEAPNSNKPPIFHNQKNKTFMPRVLSLTQGESVTFRNHDPINHNAFSLSKTKKFDLGLFKAPVEKTIKFERAGLVKVFCNIHSQMVSTLLILKNNKYTRTEADGAYKIENIPPGKYKLKVWVEGTKLSSKKITVTESSNETIDFVISTTRRLSQHLNKEGKAYKKY